MYEISYGSKYNRNQDIADIAKCVRADIKNAVKAENLPQGTKTSVRISRYSMGQSLDISVKSLGDTTIINPERTKWEQDNSGSYPGNAPSRYTDAAEKAFQHIKQITDDYNYDGSESESDYYNVNFYCHVTYKSIIVA